jgi:hypothetical protein
VAVDYKTLDDCLDSLARTKVGSRIYFARQRDASLELDTREDWFVKIKYISI